MKYAKGIWVVTVIVVALYLIVVNFSATQTRYRCEGKFTQGDQSEPMTLFFKLDSYRWWVGLWSDSEGAVSIEVPNVWVEYFSRVRKVGDQLQIRDMQDQLKGNFSTLSNAIAITIPTGIFEGDCTPMK